MRFSLYIRLLVIRFQGTDSLIPLILACGVPHLILLEISLNLRFLRLVLRPNATTPQDVVVERAAVV